MRAANPAVGFSRKRARWLSHFRENLTEIFRMSDLLPTAAHEDQLHQYRTETYLFEANSAFWIRVNDFPYDLINLLINIIQIILSKNK